MFTCTRPRRGHPGACGQVRGHTAAAPRHARGSNVSCLWRADTCPHTAPRTHSPSYSDLGMEMSKDKKEQSKANILWGAAVGKDLGDSVAFSWSGCLKEVDDPLRSPRTPTPEI